MDPFTVMLRVASAMFWLAAGLIALIYRLCRMLFFFWRKHHRSRLVLPLSARFEHTHIVGGSGHGKTQLLQQLILYDVERVMGGEASLIVIDSQGDMLSKIRSLSSVGQMADRELAESLSKAVHVITASPVLAGNVCFQKLVANAVDEMTSRVKQFAGHDPVLQLSSRGLRLLSPETVH